MCIRDSQLGFRLRDFRARGHTTFETVLRQFQRRSVRHHSIVEQFLLRVGAAQLEVIVSQFGVVAEAKGFKVGSGGLRLGARCFNGVCLLYTSRCV